MSNTVDQELLTKKAKEGKPPKPPKIVANEELLTKKAKEGKPPKPPKIVANEELLTTDLFTNADNQHIDLSDDETLTQDLSISDNLTIDEILKEVEKRLNMEKITQEDKNYCKYNLIHISKHERSVLVKEICPIAQKVIKLADILKNKEIKSGGRSTLKNQILKGGRTKKRMSKTGKKRHRNLRRSHKK
jgi:hypothetical protein